MKLGEKKLIKKISTIPSGSLALDVALGVGGYPRGRIIEVYGPESSGKNNCFFTRNCRSATKWWNSRFYRC